MGERSMHILFGPHFQTACGVDRNVIGDAWHPGPESAARSDTRDLCGDCVRVVVRALESRQEPKT